MDYVKLVAEAAGIGTFITLLVQAVKVSGVSSGLVLGLAPWVAGLVLFGLQVPGTPASELSLLGAQYLAGVVVSVLGYNYALKPLGEKAGLAITSEEIHG